MSAFGDWWVGFRNKVEAALESQEQLLIAAAEAEAPAAQAALVAAAKVGAAAALSSTGTTEERASAGLSAATQSLSTASVTLGEDLIKAAVQSETAAQTPPAVPAAQ